MRLSLAVTIWLCVALAGCGIREVNEPRPSEFPISTVESFFEHTEAKPKITKLLYLNRDFMAFIFVGHWVDGTGAPIFENPPGDMVSGEEYQRYFPGRSGELRRKSVGTEVLWGIVISTTESEWKQGRSRFEAKWREAVAGKLPDK